MPITSETHGVCSACKYETACTYVVDGAVILQCEQFEMAFPAKEVRHAALPSRRAPRNGGRSSQYAGICSNCAHQETCTYPRPEGGVWRCEEYA